MRIDFCHGNEFSFKMEDEQNGKEGWGDSEESSYTKPKDLKSATRRLRVEALRRYRVSQEGEEETESEDVSDDEMVSREGETTAADEQGEQERTGEEQEVGQDKPIEKQATSDMDSKENPTSGETASTENAEPTIAKDGEEVQKTEQPESANDKTGQEGEAITEEQLDGNAEQNDKSETKDVNISAEEQQDAGKDGPGKEGEQTTEERPSEEHPSEGRPSEEHPLEGGVEETGNAHDPDVKPTEEGKLHEGQDEPSAEGEASKEEPAASTQDVEQVASNGDEGQEGTSKEGEGGDKVPTASSAQDVEQVEGEGETVESVNGQQQQQSDIEKVPNESAPDNTPSAEQEAGSGGDATSVNNNNNNNEDNNTQQDATNANNNANETDNDGQQQEDGADQPNGDTTENTTEQAPEHNEEQEPSSGTTQNVAGEETTAPEAKETTDGQQQDAPQDDGSKVTTGEESTDNPDVRDESEKKASAEEEESPKIPVDFFYNYEEHASKASITEESGLPEDMISLHHSFGYDCKKMSNLHMIDNNTVIFAAGNVVQLLNLQTKEQRYIRSTSGGGIGAITVHPSMKYFAVAEKGDMPNINMYEYPSLKLYRILREGTEKTYSFVDFNPAGTLLASVGAAPDYMLTVWDWMQELIVLRSKAFSQDVFRVTFSPDNEGQLTTSGTGHIRFWKMADTFTGLKLQGQLGKFGRTEISDIHGYVELPDGKVLSGTEWGNMLLWDGGLIKVQISRKNRKPCHVGNIEQFVMDEGELITIGEDGFIRVWDFESIDTADSSDDSGIYEMECMNELKVGNNVHLLSMVKSVDQEVENIWYAQDSNGVIWKLDLSFSHTTKAPEKMMSYHAGQVNAIGVSPVSQLVASTADDSSVRVYDYASKTPLCSSSFNAGATALLWLPQIVDPKGSTVLAGFEDGVVRALTIARIDQHDVHHKKSTNQPSASLILKQAFKPHTKRTTSLALDSRGELLATGGADSTVFFLSVEDTFKPIGFIEVPGPVSHMTWSPGYFDKNTLLVFCVNGEVVEIEAPESGSYDTSKTFKITGLNTRQTTFRSIKSRLRREEEEARKAAEEEAKRKENERLRRIRRERGLEDEEEEEEEEPEEEPEPEPLYIPEEPSPVLYGVYSPDNPNQFWVSMGSFDAGYLYECKFHDDLEKSIMTKEGRGEAIGEPIRAVAVPDSNDIPIRTMHFGALGNQVVLGMENGMIRIQTLDDNGGKRKHIPNASQADLSTFGPYWMLNVHDNDYGIIRDVKMSADDRFLFSCGGDGNMFAFEVMTQKKIEESQAVARAKIPSARKEDEGRKISDIDSKEHYSIELEKQKAEYDKMMKLADERKMEVRRTVAKLRRQFKKLLEQNNELPNHLQLQRKEFEMDPGIRRELERQTAEKIDQVHHELAWEAEKHRIGLEKLQKRFKAELECERIVVVSIRTSHQVATYRTTNMSEDFVHLKHEMTRRATIMSDKVLSRDHTRDTLTGLSKESDSLSDTLLTAGGTKDLGAKKASVLKGRLGEKVAKQLQKAEKIKQRRLARESQWNELYASKPPEDFEDPSDVAAIKEAQENMGDAKLKTAKDYVVPEHLRMNALKKRNQLLTLEELIHKHKSDFNNLVKSLRDKKVCLIDEIKQNLVELSEIQAKLADDQRQELPVCPQLLPCETPEKKMEYTKDSLLKFKEEMAQKAIAEKTGGDGGMFGFGGGGGGNNDKKPGTASKPTGTPSNRALSSLSLRTPIPSMMDAAAAGKELSPLEEQLRSVEEIRLLYRQEELIQHIRELIVEFDAELRMLRHDKFRLDVDLKNADLRRVTLFEELKLLKDFEKREDVFAEKVEAKFKEKNDMQQKVFDCQQRLDMKRKDIERLQEKEKALYATFQASLGENNKFAEFLNRVFKKKIKRAKKKAQTEEGSDEESEESSDDESDWDSKEEDSDEDGLDDSVCPPGCDQALFDNTCALREKRLDFEEANTEEKKTAEALKKEVDALTKKQKVIETNLKTAEADLEAFQLEKQQKLNELDVVVTLNLNQVEHVVNGQMPQDLSSCLVFTNAGMTRLQKRIRELKEEKTAQRRHYKQHRQQHVQLIKDRKLMENRIEELQEKCNEMMRLKFGRIVDLEKLEAVGVNRTVEELKERLRINEGTNAEELHKWKSKIEAKKARITELTQENTERLRQLTLLVGENKTLEKALDTRQTSLGGEFQGVRKTDVEERQRLIQLVQLQAQEIEALKEEISLLSRKGGHILPPTQPPIPQGSPTVRPPMNGAS